jgi:hypothetical protein
MFVMADVILSYWRPIPTMASAPGLPLGAPSALICAFQGSAVQIDAFQACASGDILLVDGVSYLLMTDGTTRIMLGQ